MMGRLCYFITPQLRIFVVLRLSDFNNDYYRST